jgi:hypothetical protein
VAFAGNEALILGTATNISTLLSITDVASKSCRQIALRIAGANDAFYGRSTVTATTNRAGILKVADTGPTILGGDGTHALNTDDIYIIGTAAGGNIVFITLIR